MDINSVIASKEYDFLRTNPRLKSNIVFLTFGGSHAYGTNTETSDVDVRGCAFNSISDLLGLSNFEQVLDDATDTTIYAFNKLISLISVCNPNTIEMLGCRPEHYALLSPVGERMIANRHMFLSRRACYSFGGYANQQLRRLQNALAHDSYTPEVMNSHIANGLEYVIQSFNSRYSVFPSGGMKVYSESDDVFADVNLSHYSLRDLNGMLSEFSSIIKDYDKLKNRNKKKDDLHLNKHAMHLVRLYLMCFDILEKEEIVTYRQEEHDLLMSIRNGAYQKEDGTFRAEFFDIINGYEQRMKYDKENTSLPDSPNYKKIEEFVIDVNRQVVLNEG